MNIDPRVPSNRPAGPLEIVLPRRRWLRRMLLGMMLPVAGGALWRPGALLAATEEDPETENNWEGPFYKPGAPVRSVLLEAGMAGTPLTLTGRVLNTRGRPLKGALLDIWHADNTGTYDNKGFQLRGRIYTDDDGRYTLRTIKPLHYGDPGDMRPSHIHVKASPGRGPCSPPSSTSRGMPGTVTMRGCAHR